MSDFLPCAICGKQPLNADWFGPWRRFGCVRNGCQGNVVRYRPAGHRRLRAVIRLWNYQQRLLLEEKRATQNDLQKHG